MGEVSKKGSFWGSEMAKIRKNTIQNAKKVIKMSPVTVFTQSPGYNVIFCVFEKGANNILFSIPPTPKRTPKRPPLPGPPLGPAPRVRSHAVGVYKLLLRGSRSPIWGVSQVLHVCAPTVYRD